MCFILILNKTEATSGIALGQSWWEWKFYICSRFQDFSMLETMYRQVLSSETHFIMKLSLSLSSSILCRISLFSVIKCP
jgi:hypothetical protein